MVGVSIVGGTGYGAGELLRLISLHPQLQLVEVVSKSQAGEKIAAAHPHLSGVVEGDFVSQLSTEKLKEFERGVVFVALPHGASAELLLQLESFLENGSVVIDLSGDFRLKEQATHEKHYPGSPFAAKLRSSAVYGLPELFREEISGASFISNPGCYATVCALAAAPIVNSGLGIYHIAIDAKSGSSGAGRATKDLFHHPRRNASMTAYSVLSHRHEPEIKQTLQSGSKGELSLSFVPHLLPISRGIFATAHILLEKETSQAEIAELFCRAYQEEFFVRLRETAPEIGDVVGSNFCDISFAVRGKVVVVTAVLDNLVKGMAGQAIQNLNLICGLPEDMGLKGLGLGLV